MYGSSAVVKTGGGNCVADVAATGSVVVVVVRSGVVVVDVGRADVVVAVADDVDSGGSLVSSEHATNPAVPSDTVAATIKALANRVTNYSQLVCPATQYRKFVSRTA
jgi:uncharacterized protein YbjT (DUF2867 family)